MSDPHNSRPCPQRNCGCATIITQYALALAQLANGADPNTITAEFAREFARQVAAEAERPRPFSCAPRSGDDP